MTSRVLVRYADRRPEPWVNGLGSTTELVGWSRSRELQGAGPAWRLSIARLDGPATFSPLPGVDRHFLPVGADVRLRIAGVDTPVPAGRVCRFSGDDPVELLDLRPAPAHAVNLMVRASGGGPRMVVTDSRDPRCGAAVVALALAPGPGYATFDIISIATTLDRTSGRELALVLPGPDGAPLVR